jgi:hypothetical protein
LPRFLYQIKNSFEVRSMEHGCELELFDASAAKVMIMSCKSIDGVQN